MKKFVIIILIMLLCSVGFAANKWVAPADATPAGSNANAGTAEAPYLTIQYALDNMGGSGTITVAAGTYATNTYLTVNGTHTGWDIVIDGAGQGSTIIPLTHASIGFWFDDTTTGAGAFLTGSVTLKDLTLTSNAALAAGLLRCESDAVTASYGVVIDNCALGDATANQIVIYLRHTGGDARTLEIKNSSVVAGGTGVATVISEGSASITLADSTFVSTAVVDMFALSATIGTITSTNCTYTASGNASSLVSIFETDGATSGTSAVFKNNTFNMSGNYHNGVNLKYYFDIVEVADNTFNVSCAGRPGVSISIGVDGDTSDHVLNMVVVKSNTITRTGDGESSHGILLGAGVNYPECYGNVITMNAVNTNQVNLGIVVKGEGADIRYNIVKASEAIYLKGGARNKIINNTLIANGEYALHLKTSTDIPSNNIIENNILDGSAGTHALYVENGVNNIFNKNCYVAGSTDVANINSADKDFAELKAYWATLTYFKDNDVSSIAENPQFHDTTNYMPTNANLKLLDGTWIGAGAPLKFLPRLKN
jgi:hypothetical protein